MALPVRISRGRANDSTELSRNDLGSVLGQFFGRGLFTDTDDGDSLAALSNYGVDIREDADHLYVEADLPGFRKEDVDVLLENGMLTIVAEHKEEVRQPPPQQQQAQQGDQSQQAQSQQQSRQDQHSSQQQQSQSQQRQNFLLHERRIKRFVRSFTLPPNVDESDVQAKLENGVLKITLNKREESKPRRIQLA